MNGPQPPERYEMKYRCANCCANFTHSVPWGTPCGSYAGGPYCPGCGCREAVKLHIPIRFVGGRMT